MTTGIVDGCLLRWVSDHLDLTVHVEPLQRLHPLTADLVQPETREQRLRLGLVAELAIRAEQLHDLLQTELTELALTDAT